MASGEEMWGRALPASLDPPLYCKPNMPSSIVLPRHDGHEGYEGDEGREGDEVSALNGTMAGMPEAAAFRLVNRAPTP